MTTGYDKLLATVVPDPVAESNSAPLAGSRFSDLQREIRAAGLMNVRHGYYVWKSGVNLLMLAAGWAVFFVVGSSWWQLLTAMFLAFCYVQIGLVGHDVGHNQVSRNRRTLNLLGYLHGNLLLGFSFEWWVNHHNRHHTNPNHVDKDPDILRRRSIFTVSQADQPMTAFRRFVVRHQEKVFFPMALLEFMGLRVISIRVIRQRTVRRVWLEGGLIALHMALYLTAVVWVLGPIKAIVFVLVHQSMVGLYSGLIFATNHKGMPVSTHQESADWMTRQVITARNLRGGTLTTYLYGGLNYQIEHHLFPSMPRPNLRKAQPIVRAHCDAAGLRYHETSVAYSYVEILRHLRKVSLEARPRLG